MRELSLGASHALHQTGFIELDHWLGHVKVDGAAFDALAVENLCECFHALEFTHQRSVLLTHAVVAIEDCLHFVVSHAGGGANYSFVKLVAYSLTCMIKFHDAGEHHALDLRTQAAEIS